MSLFWRLWLSLALAFGLLHTMLMTIFERTRELGVLISVGMSKKRVFLMILLETTFLVITGSVTGSLLGAFTVFDAVIFPSLDNSYYLYLAALVLVTSFLASVYPAIKALRLNPADAVRRE